MDTIPLRLEDSSVKRRLCYEKPRCRVCDCTPEHIIRRAYRKVKVSRIPNAKMERNRRKYKKRPSEVDNEEDLLRLPHEHIWKYTFSEDSVNDEATARECMNLDEPPIPVYVLNVWKFWKPPKSIPTYASFNKQRIFEPLQPPMPADSNCVNVYSAFSKKRFGLETMDFVEVKEYLHISLHKIGERPTSLGFPLSKLCLLFHIEGELACLVRPNEYTVRVRYKICCARKCIIVVQCVSDHISIKDMSLCAVFEEIAMLRS